MSTFLHLVDNLVEELGNAVAFASAPLNPQTLTSQNPMTSKEERSQSLLKYVVASQEAMPRATAGLQESFYVVPQATRATSANSNATIASR